MSSEMFSMSLINTWIKALTAPNEETYQQIADDPNASLGKSALLVFLAGVVGGLISGFANYFKYLIGGPTSVGGFGDFGEFLPEIPASEPTIIGAIVSSPLAGFVSVIGALVFVGLVFVVSRALGGTGDYENLFNTMAAYQVPLGVVTTLVGVIPVVNCLGFILGIYGLVLAVIANKVVMRYDWGKAVIASVVVPIIIAAIIFFCVVVVLGAAISAVFGNILDSLNSIP